MSVLCGAFQPDALRRTQIRGTTEKLGLDQVSGGWVSTMVGCGLGGALRRKNGRLGLRRPFLLDIERRKLAEFAKAWRHGPAIWSRMAG